jgi:hypothetical protein
MAPPEDVDDMKCTQTAEESGSRPDYLPSIIEAVDGLSSELRRISLEIHGKPFPLLKEG